MIEAQDDVTLFVPDLAAALHLYRIALGLASVEVSPRFAHQQRDSRTVSRRGEGAVLWRGQQRVPRMWQ